MFSAMMLVETLNRYLASLTPKPVFNGHPADERLKLAVYRFSGGADLNAKTHKHANPVDAISGPSLASQQEANCANQ
jgi:hypothetical protein